MEYKDRHDYVRLINEVFLSGHIIETHEHVYHEVEYSCKNCGKQFYGIQILWKTQEPYWYDVLNVGERRPIRSDEFTETTLRIPGRRWTEPLWGKE
jgi:hypothetical protein